MMNRRFMRMNVLLFECKTQLCPNSLVRVTYHENVNPKISVAMGIYSHVSRSFGHPLSAHRGQAATQTAACDPEDKDKYDLKRRKRIQKGRHTHDCGQQQTEDLNRGCHSENFFRFHRQPDQAALPSSACEKVRISLLVSSAPPDTRYRVKPMVSREAASGRSPLRNPRDTPKAP